MTVMECETVNDFIALFKNLKAGREIRKSRNINQLTLTWVEYIVRQDGMPDSEKVRRVNNLMYAFKEFERLL